MAMTAPAASTAVPVQPGALIQRLRQRCVAFTKLGGREHSYRAEGREDVEHRGDDERTDDGPGEAFTGVLGLFAAGRYRVETDIGEEDDRCRRDNPPAPAGANGVKLSALIAVAAAAMKNTSTASLMITMTKFA